MRYLLWLLAGVVVWICVLLAIIWIDYQNDMKIIESQPSTYDDPCDDNNSHIPFRLNCDFR